MLPAVRGPKTAEEAQSGNIDSSAEWYCADASFRNHVCVYACVLGEGGRDQKTGKRPMKGWRQGVQNQGGESNRTHVV